MAQHKASLERVMRSALRHKRAGTEVATAILAIEAMVLTSISQNEIVENTDKKVLGRCRVGLCHKSFGKRLADAISTMDAIIAAESLTIEAKDKALRGQSKAGLRAICIAELNSKSTGKLVSDMVSKAEQAIDLLTAAYPADADLVNIKAILES
jgi:hypothetical protein